MLSFLNKAWGHIKPHAVPILLTLAVVVVGWHLFSRQRDDYVDALRKHREIHDKQLQDILAAQETERKQRAENFEKLQRQLEDVKLTYERDIKDLQEKKTQQVGKLVQKYKDDPTGMAQQLSDITGFQLYKPGK